MVLAIELGVVVGAGRGLTAVSGHEVFEPVVEMASLPALESSALHLLIRVWGDVVCGVGGAVCVWWGE